MAGIYIHIPFCKRRCIYCDFFSTTRSEQKAAYIHALCQELELRKDYLESRTAKPLTKAVEDYRDCMTIKRPHLEKNCIRTP